MAPASRRAAAPARVHRRRIARAMARHVIARDALEPARPRGFAPLAERSGYAIAESRTAVVSEQVLLRPRGLVAPSR
jgi:hypothetical protein